MNDRDVAIAALRANPMAIFEADHEARLADPAADLAFEELNLDSLGLMELSIWLELELGLETTEVELQQIATLNGLAAFIAAAEGRDAA